MIDMGTARPSAGGELAPLCAPRRETGPPAPCRLERAEGTLELTFAATGIRVARQAGCLRVRFPKGAADGFREGAILNTAGGLAGGDALRIGLSCEPGARVRLATVAAEKVYRSLGDAATVEMQVTLAPGAALEWLPQETILFDRGRLRRSLAADIAPSASLLMIEAAMLGRAAMGERVRTGSLVESWRVRRGGRLVFADQLRLDGPIADIAARPAVLAGAAAFATVLLVAPEAETRLDGVRAVLESGPAQAGASAWDGRLVARLAARDGAALRAGLGPLLAVLRSGRPLPRVWTI